MHFLQGGSPAEKVNDYLKKVVHFLKKDVTFFADGDLAGKHCKYMQMAVHENTCPLLARHLVPGASSASSATYFPI